MAAYLVVTINISDAERFGAYLQAVAGLSQRFGGEGIVRGPVSEYLEGSAPEGERVVVVRFASAEDIRTYISSDVYQEAKRNRLGAADVTMRIVED